MSHLHPLNSKHHPGLWTSNAAITWPYPHHLCKRTPNVGLMLAQRRRNQHWVGENSEAESAFISPEATIISNN